MHPPFSSVAPGFRNGEVNRAGDAVEKMVVTDPKWRTMSYHVRSFKDAAGWPGSRRSERETPASVICGFCFEKLSQAG
jgi:hypothetical protein